MSSRRPSPGCRTAPVGGSSRPPTERRAKSGWVVDGTSLHLRARAAGPPCASDPGDTVKENFRSSQRLKALTCALAVSASFVGVRRVAAIDDIAFALREENVRVVGRDGSDQAGSAVAVGDA